MCISSPLLTHIKHTILATPAPWTALPGRLRTADSAACGTLDSLPPRLWLPALRAYWLTAGVGGACRTEPSALGSVGHCAGNARSCAGSCSLATSDAPGPRSFRGCYPGGSRGLGAGLRLRNGSSGTSYGPAEAVSTSFAPWPSRSREYSRVIGCGWVGKRARSAP